MLKLALRIVLRSVIIALASCAMVNIIMGVY